MNLIDCDFTGTCGKENIWKCYFDFLKVSGIVTMTLAFLFTSYAMGTTVQTDQMNPSVSVAETNGNVHWMMDVLTRTKCV